MDINQGGSGVNNSSDFVRKLYKMLEDPSYEQVVRWGNEGDSFVVLEVDTHVNVRKIGINTTQNEKFTKSILPKHFKHSNFASFVRQLNKYDFHKVRHSNEDNGQSPYGAGAWEFKHPDFRANNKDALDNIRRKAPAPRKPNQPPDDLIPTQQMDLVNSQLVATQQQLQQLQERYNELSVHHSMLLQELIGLQKTVVNHEHVIQNVMSFLHTIDAQRRRDSRLANPFAPIPENAQNGNVEANQPNLLVDDEPASPLQHASKLLSETNADAMLNPKNLEHMNEMTMRMNGNVSTPPTDALRVNGIRPASRSAPASATSSTSMRFHELDGLVYPVGQTNGIDPMYGDHVNNIPYPMPTKPLEPSDPRYQAVEKRKKSTHLDPGWIRQPRILLVEDDPTCRRIGGKFLYAFQCSIDSALDGLEAVNKMNAGHKYDLLLMDIIMPNLDGVSACHLIRQFDNSTPIIAMTSNIRNDDISMYFQHGMNDVLPKPFTKEGLLQMLEKHLGHLKKQPHGVDPMAPGPVQSFVQNSARHSLKDDDSPAKSPATISTWNSPAQIPGASVSPAASGVTEEYMNAMRGHSNSYSIENPMINSGLSYGSSPPATMQAPDKRPPHRRHISEVSGSEDGNASKRQQMYPPPIQSPSMNPLQRQRTR